MKEILNQVIHGRVHVHIGKAGLTNGIINQIDNQYKKKRIIKIRFLSMENFESVKEAANTLANLTKSNVLDIRGKTVVLQKRKGQRKFSK